MLRISFSAAFKKDYRLMKRRRYDMSALDNTIAMLAREEKLPESYRDHALIGKYKGCRECHIGPDWLLVYEIKQQNILLHLTRTGTHSDIFT